MLFELSWGLLLSSSCSFRSIPIHGDILILRLPCIVISILRLSVLCYFFGGILKIAYFAAADVYLCEYIDLAFCEMEKASSIRDSACRVYPLGTCLTIPEAGVKFFISKKGTQYVLNAFVDTACAFPIASIAAEDFACISAMGVWF
jgi:hypothetical protein